MSVFFLLTKYHEACSHIERLNFLFLMWQEEGIEGDKGYLRPEMLYFVERSDH